MPKIAYIEKRFSASSLLIIQQANKIITDYQMQGFDLTLRQLFYQFVSRDLISNKQTEYKRLGSIINDARLAGKIDWNSIEDRTRNLKALPYWDSPSEILETCARQFKLDKWENQEYRLEVWIEKDALIGVIENVCNKHDVSYFSCRGYTSQSEMWRAAQRLSAYYEDFGQPPIVIHLGDHDPSGIDMTRDITSRFLMFAEGDEPDVRRIALNRDQIDKYKPPPNPAKTTDSRYKTYILEHGDESWELDALEPQVIADLIDNTISALKDEDKWDEKVEKENEEKAKLSQVAKNWK